MVEFMQGGISGIRVFILPTLVIYSLNWINMRYRIFFLLSLVLVVMILMFAGYKVHQSHSGVLYRGIESLDERLGKIKSDLLGKVFGISKTKTETEITREITRGEIETGLLNLQVEWMRFSNARQSYHGTYDYTGGAIAAGDDFYLLLDPLGELYVGTEQHWPEKTAINVPAIDQQAYEEVKQGDQAYKNAKFQQSPFKYNDLLLHSENESTTILVSYTDFDASEKCFQNIIAGYELENRPGYESLKSTVVSSDEWKIIYKSEPCLPLNTSGWTVMGQMAGGRIAQYDGDTILLENGEFLREELALDPNNHYGKSLFINIHTGVNSVFSEGHRNMGGLTVSNNTVFAVEHGARGGDELNILKLGEHFGWPKETYGTSYSRTPMPFTHSFGRHTEFAAPLFSWIPSIGPSGIIRLVDFHKNWQGDLMISSLVAQSLFRVRLQDERVVYVEQIPYGKRIRDLAELNGKLIVFSDDMSVGYITPAELTGMDEVLLSFAGQASLDDSEVKKLESGISLCIQCHSMVGNDHSKAPGLQHIYGATAGTGIYPDYSAAMRRADIVWNEENLARFLVNPQKVIPGTNMQAASVDDETLQLIIAFLKYTNWMY